MNPMKKRLRYFSKKEWALLAGSLLAVVSSFLLFDKEAGLLTLIAPLVGVISLIFCAKGHPVGQALMIVFSLLYGWISFRVSYYGEMLTYLGMTLPMAVVGLVSWLRHPYKGERTQVEVASLTKRTAGLMLLLTVPVTVIFYFVLKAFDTANLIVSTVSVATSFAAAYLTYCRSPYFALAYALNDVVLIVLWGLAALHDVSYMSVTVCFVMFLFNDLYGFVNWRRMKERQKK